MAGSQGCPFTTDKGIKDLIAKVPPSKRRPRGPFLRYKVYGHPYQQYTYVNLKGIAPPDVYSHADEVLRERFGRSLVKVNHAGRTVSIVGVPAE